MLRYATAAAPDDTAVAAAREAFLAGETCDPAAVRTEVHEAWVRSRTAGVNPELREVPLLLEGRSLQEHQAGHELYQAGITAIQVAAALLEETGCALFLADEEGIVLYAGGDRGMLRQAWQVGSLPGASWQEHLVGNNAVGTSLVTGKPVQFRGAEHWSAGWADWACFAAPVYDRQGGRLLGTIALVTHRKTAKPEMLPYAAQVAGSLAAQVEALQQTRAALVQAQAVDLQRRCPASRKIVGERDGRGLLFDLADVLAIVTVDGRVCILTEGGRWLTPYRSLRDIARRLPPGSFFQVDRSTMVNLDRVREIHPMFNRTVTLILSDRHRTAIPVSRRRSAALRHLLGF